MIVHSGFLKNCGQKLEATKTSLNEWLNTLQYLHNIYSAILRDKLLMDNTLDGSQGYNVE